MPHNKTQREKFEEAVREFGVDENARAYDAAVEKVAKAPKLTDDEIKALAKRLRSGKTT
jgi:DNA-directed RNA polymerase sigma subunit (sigma70/sigma32)